MKKLSALTKDPLFLSVLKFSLPVMADQFFLFLIDMALISFCKIAGPAATSAVGLSTAINNIVWNVSVNMAIAGAVIASQHLGRSDEAGAKDVAKQSVYFGTAIIIVYSVLLFIFREPVIAMIYGRSSPEVLREVISYISIAVWSYPFIFYMLQGYAILRAAGDSKTPMYINLISVFVNISLGFVLIAGFKGIGGYGAVGSALTFVISRVIACILVTYSINNQYFKLKFNFTLKYKPNWKVIKEIYAIAIPGIFEGLFFSVGRLVSQAYTTLLTTADIAANSIANNLASLVCFPTMGYVSATAPLVGRAIGERDIKKAKRTSSFALLQVYITTLLVCSLVFVFANFITSLYTSDLPTQNLAAFLIRADALAVTLIYIPSFLLPAAFRGAGSAKFPMLIANISMGIRVALGYFLSIMTPMGVFGIWAAMFFDWIIRMVFYLPYFFTSKWLHATGLIAPKEKKR